MAYQLTDSLLQVRLELTVATHVQYRHMTCTVWLSLLLRDLSYIKKKQPSETPWIEHANDELMLKQNDKFVSTCKNSSHTNTIEEFCAVWRDDFKQILNQASDKFK